MTIRQKLMKFTYPILEKITNFLKINNKIVSANTKANVSFYDLKALQNSGTILDFGMLKNKKTLIVNTASNCGYTAQYDGLEALYKLHKNELEIIAFPANDFKEQEKDDDNTIAEFCKINFGVTFPIMKKSVVITNSEQNTVYQWLTQKDKNGWNTKAPNWNFCKYLIDENGNLTHFFEPSVAPMGVEIMAALKK